MIKKRLAIYSDVAETACHHIHMHYSSSMPNCGVQKCSMCGADVTEILEDLGLTHTQYFGGPSITSVDQNTIQEKLLERLGNFNCGIPSTRIDGWGYWDWIKWIDRSTFGGL